MSRIQQQQHLSPNKHPISADSTATTTTTTTTTTHAINNNTTISQNQNHDSTNNDNANNKYNNITNGSVTITTPQIQQQQPLSSRITQAHTIFNKRTTKSYQEAHKLFYDMYMELRGGFQMDNNDNMGRDNGDDKMHQGSEENQNQRVPTTTVPNAFNNNNTNTTTAATKKQYLTILKRLALVERYLNSFDSAKQHLLESLSLQKSQSVAVMMTLAKVQLHQRHFQEAEEWIRKAMALKKELGKSVTQEEALLLLTQEMRDGKKPWSVALFDSSHPDAKTQFSVVSVNSNTTISPKSLKRKRTMSHSPTKKSQYVPLPHVDVRQHPRSPSTDATDVWSPYSPNQFNDALPYGPPTPPGYGYPPVQQMDGFFPNDEMDPSWDVGDGLMTSSPTSAGPFSNQQRGFDDQHSEGTDDEDETTHQYDQVLDMNVREDGNRFTFDFPHGDRRLYINGSGADEKLIAFVRLFIKKLELQPLASQGLIQVYIKHRRQIVPLSETMAIFREARFHPLRILLFIFNDDDVEEQEKKEPSGQNSNMLEPGMEKREDGCAQKILFELKWSQF